MKKHPSLHAISTFFYPVTAGIETNMLETYAVLAKAGWDITIHTSQSTHDQHNHLPATQTLRGLTIKRYPYWFKAFFPSIPTDAASILALHNFDILPHLYILLWLGVRKGLGLSIPTVVLTPHGGFTPEWRIFIWPARVFKYVYHYTVGVWLINRLVRGIRAVSQWEKDEMVHQGVRPSLITVIPNGLENEAYQEVDARASAHVKVQVKTYGHYLLAMGRVYPIKNYETMIRALPALPATLQLIILGGVQGKRGMAYKGHLLELAKQLHVEARVHFLGVVHGIDKYYWLKHAQAFVHMAIWESFCNVVHEAMSQGTIAIVANNTNLKRLVTHGETGYLVETHDAVTLAKTIRKVLDVRYRSQHQAISRHIITLTQSHSWVKVAQKVEQWMGPLLDNTYSTQAI